MRTVKRNNLVDQSVEIIKEYITTHTLQPGDKLPSQVELSNMMNVSHRVTREAIKSLEAVGILNVKPGDGIYVSSLDYAKLAANVRYVLERDGQDVATLAEARWCLESSAIKLAMERLGEGDIKKLEETVDRMYKAKTVEEIIAAESTFHKAIVGMTGNPVLIEFATLIDDFLASASERFDFNMNDQKQNAEGHRILVDALRNGDLDSAAKFFDFLREYPRMLTSDSSSL